MSSTVTTIGDRTRDDVAPTRVFARACAAEWTRMWTVRSTWWFTIIAAVVLVGLGTLLGFESAADAPELQGEPAWTTARFIAMPAQFAFLGLALIAVTSDYATGGIVTNLQWTPRRGTFFAARTLVTVTVATGIGVALTVASAMAANTTAGDALTLHLDDGLDMLSRVGFVFTAGTVLAVGLGFLLRNTAGGIITAFLLMLILPLLLPLFGEWMQTVAGWLPGSGAIYFLTGEARGMTNTSSILVLSAWALGILLFGGLRLLRDDANH